MFLPLCCHELLEGRDCLLCSQHPGQGLTHNRLLHCLTNIPHALTICHHGINTTDTMGEEAGQKRWPLDFTEPGEGYQERQGRVTGGWDLEAQRENKWHMQKVSRVARIRIGSEVNLNMQSWGDHSKYPKSHRQPLKGFQH